MERSGRRPEQEEGGWGQTGPSWSRAGAGEVRRRGARAGGISVQGRGVPGEGSRTGGSEGMPGRGGPFPPLLSELGPGNPGLPVSGSEP